MLANPEAIAATITRQLEAAWNAGDGHAYGAFFAEDADYITVLGHLIRSRQSIASAHQGIFHTIYKGSTVRQTVVGARTLTDDVIIAHVNIVLSVPAGYIAGDHNALQTLIIINQGGVWRVAHFQNTLIVPH